MPKQILVLVANPEGTTRLNLPRELKQLQEAVQRSQQRDYFNVELRFAAGPTELHRHILDVRPQMLHFCGHGTAQGLVLEGDGGATVVSNQFLTSLLKDFADRIECVLLNACDTGPLTDALAEHLNCVIGMSQAVRDDAAIAFAEAFYDALGAGEGYEKAFQIGRTAILGQAGSRDAQNRKATAVDPDGRPVKPANQEHQIPVLKLNPNPKPIQAFWLAPEAERQAVRELLTAIEGGFNTIQLFHTREPIVLQDQYIPVQVTLERRYRHSVETIGAYAESEAELKRLYAMKGSGDEKAEEEVQRQQVDWQEARKRESRIVVLADPGMGKTTLLRREVGTTVQQGLQQIEQGAALNEIILPVLIRLSTLADRVEQMPILDAILAIMQERHSDLLEHREEVSEFLNGFLKAQLLRGNVLLLLDALDEVPDRQRPRLLEKLNEFAKVCTKVAMVGTSRIVGYGGRLVDGAKDMEIVPFTQPQTEQYINQWFENAKASLTDPSVTARGLIQALRERPQIAGLAQNPLLLSLICSLYQHDKLTLPARRSQIYEQAVTCMLSEWGQTRLHPQGNPDNLKEAKTRLLEALAYHFTCEGREVFDYADLYDWVEAYLEADAPRDLRDAKTADLIAELSEADGMLQKLYRDRSDNQYLFLHRTFQEYFTASYLKRAIKTNKKNPAYVTELVQTYCWNYDWHETLTLLAGLLEKPMPLIETILAQKDDIFQTQLLLAGRCVAECQELSHPLVDEMIDRIYQLWLKYSDAEFIQSVVVVLGQTQEKLVSVLQTALEHDNLDVKYRAVDTLRKIGNNKTVNALFQALSDQNFRVRRSAARALAELGNDAAVGALTLALSDQDWAIRHDTAVALGEIGNDKVVDALFRSLSDQVWNVRRSAAWALGKIGNGAAINALLLALSHQESDVRDSEAKALVKIRNDAVAKALVEIGNDAAVDALIQALFHQDWNVTNIAAEALGEIGNDAAVDALILALSDQDSRVRADAAQTLGKIGNDKAVDALIQALFHQYWNVRNIAAKALGEIGNDKAVDALILALSDQDSWVRANAAKALGKIGNGKAVDALILALSDQDDYVRSNAAEALGKIGNDKAVDALILALSDQDSRVRSNAAWALGEIGDEEAVNALIRALSHREEYIRSTVVEALGKIGNDAAVDALIWKLSDQDEYIRSEAVKALVKIDNDVVVDALIRVLSDRSQDVRSKAVEVLVKIGNDAAVDALIRMLSHQNQDVRSSAAWTLFRIGNDKAVDALIRVLSSQDKYVAYYSVWALGNIGDGKAVDALILALSDQESYVRSNAAEALGKIGNGAAVNALILALSDQNQDVRRSAVEALVKIGDDCVIDST